MLIWYEYRLFLKDGLQRCTSSKYESKKIHNRTNYLSQSSVLTGMEYKLNIIGVKRVIISAEIEKFSGEDGCSQSFGVLLKQKYDLLYDNFHY